MKRIFILLFLFSSAGMADAQFVKGIGIRIGTTVANQTWHQKRPNATTLKEYAQGTYCAVSAEFLKGKTFTIVTDVAYSQKGCEEGLPDGWVNLPKNYSTYKTYDTRFNYLSSSILLKARFENTLWIPYGFAGLRLDYQLSYSSDYDFKPLEKYMNKKIWGLDYGFGLEYKINNGGVSAEFRHHYDFDNMLDVPYSDGYSGVEVKNNAYVFNLGIKYYLRSKRRVQVKPS